MKFKLNFIGLYVADFNRIYSFYTETLGIELNLSVPGWASLKTSGMTFELFEHQAEPGSRNRSWGNGQAFRPGIQVTDLAATISELEQKGVTFAGNIERKPWGRLREFITPDGIRWTLAEAPDYPANADLRVAHIGWVELKANDLEAQKTFYGDLMGLTLAAADQTQMMFVQQLGEPLLFLEGGGQKTTPKPAPHHFEGQAGFLSFETEAIDEAASYILAQGVLIVREVVQHEWGGTDMLIADADGNLVQIVQYNTGPYNENWWQHEAVA